MRMCESYKCKRLALGLTQADFGRLVGVSGGTISRFENGEELTTAVFNKIKYGIEEYIRELDRDEYLELRLLEGVFSLRYEEDANKKMFILNHMANHISKMNMDLLKELKEI